MALDDHLFIANAAIILVSGRQTFYIKGAHINHPALVRVSTAFRGPHMSSVLSRRNFLARSTIGAGAIAGGQLLTLPSALASTSILNYGPASGIAKLNANENPYGPSPAAITAMMDATRKGAYYVNDSVTRLLEMIAERNGITPEHIALSSGSSGVLTYLALEKLQQGKILGPDLFWDTTTRSALRHGSGELKRTAKTADLSMDLDALYNAITPDVAMVQICNPNNPTAILTDAKALREFCVKASKKCTVLVDEAYNEITDDPEANSMIDLVRDGHDVYVAKTFSKIYGMAGLRVGYMMAAPEKIESMSKFGLGNYAMNQAGVAAAVASYNDFEFLNYSKTRIFEARQMINEVARANGLKPAPSQTSFVFIDLGDLNAETFRQEMAKRQIMIRGIYQDYTNWSRVSTGLLPDVERFVKAVPEVLDAMKA